MREDFINEIKKKVFGGDVRYRTAVQNQATPNVYMLREVVWV